MLEIESAPFIEQLIDSLFSQLTDDEALLQSESRSVDQFTQSIVGKWRQVRLENMEKYLKAEGASWIFRKMALSIPPELEIADIGNRFVIITVRPVILISIMYRMQRKI